MNAKAFTDALKLYYGPAYTEVERQVLGPWLVRFERQGGDFAALFDAVTERVSKAFGKLPDKAQLAEAAKGLDRRDPNALPTLPRRPWTPLTEQEQAEVDRLSDLSSVIPGYRPSGVRWGVRQGVARIGAPLASHFGGQS